VSRPRRAAILAAGLGSRLGDGGRQRPKCLTPVGGRPLLLRTLGHLDACGFTSAVIVVGHLADQVTSAVGPRHGAVEVTYVHSDRYATTNNAYSLWLARDHLHDATLVLDADVAFERAVLERIVGHDSDVVAVAPWHDAMQGSVVQV
jgi:choline kinase